MASLPLQRAPQPQQRPPVLPHVRVGRPADSGAGRRVWTVKSQPDSRPAAPKSIMIRSCQPPPRPPSDSHRKSLGLYFSIQVAMIIDHHQDHARLDNLQFSRSKFCLPKLSSNFGSPGNNLKLDTPQAARLSELCKCYLYAAAQPRPRPGPRRSVAA